MPGMVLAIVLGMLAVWRVARLVTADLIFDPVRRWAGRTDDEGHSGRPSLAYFVECPWCVSIWVGLPMMTVAVLWPDNRAVLAVLAGLASSGVAGLMATIEARLDRD